MSGRFASESGRSKTEQRPLSSVNCIKYLQAIEKENKKSKPGTVKTPKLKKASLSDGHRITSLGRQYLMLIEA